MDDPNMNNSVNKHCHIVAMPYPGRGHINPMLNLCKLILLTKPNITITFVVTEEWLGFLSSELVPPANLEFAALPQVIPSEIGRAGDFPAFIEAVLTKLQDPFERLLDTLELPVTAIIYDIVLTWVVGVGNRRSIPVVSLITMSASLSAVFFHFDLLVQHGHFPLDVSERGSELVDYIPGLPSTAIMDLPTIFNGDGRKILHRFLESYSAVNNAQYVLFTSLYEIEGPVIDCLKTKLSIPVYCIGPLIPYFNHKSVEDKIGAANSHEEDSYFHWLDSQPKGSVLYISQGSFLSVSSDQMIEIVEGIKKSGVRFLWVTRGDNSRFKNGIGDVGLLVSWCDQLKVLCHPSVGAFWTHCGWNSTSEGIYAGVPMLTCPIFWDQICNSKLIVKDLRIGWRVLGNDLLPQQLVARQEIAAIVVKFMDPKSEERKEMVERAKGFRDISRRAVVKGGSGSSDLHAFINRISGLSI